MNSGDLPATVHAQTIGACGNSSPRKSRCRQEEWFRFEIPDNPSIASYLIESTVPVSAAWSGSDDVGTAFVAGIAIDA